MFKQLILDGQKAFEKANFIERDHVFPMDLLHLNKIISFVWPRRVWKTTIMKQVLKHFISQGIIKPEQILRIDWNEINPLHFDISQVLASYFSLYPDSEPFVIIDEVHELPDWVRQVFMVYNKGYTLFISGSNAHVLSSELSTKLRGKVYEQRIYELSWSEYCRFRWVTYDFSTQGKGVLKSLFEEYLLYGGFPEVALVQDKEIKKWLLKNYFEVLVYKDLIERYNIGKEFVIKYLIQYLSATITKEFSVQHLVNSLKSQGITISKMSIYNYLEYLQNIFFVYSVRQKYRQRGAVKYYLYDVGYTKLWNHQGIWKNFENFVVNYYQQQWKTLSFWQNTWWEIDLVYDNEAIQICWELNAENIERETKSLLKSPIKNKTLIYYSLQEGLLLPENIVYRNIFDVFAEDAKN